MSKQHLHIGDKEPKEYKKGNSKRYLLFQRYSMHILYAYRLIVYVIVSELYD